MIAEPACSWTRWVSVISISPKPAISNAERNCYIDWELEDPKGRPVEQVRATRDEIQGRVRQLVAELDAR
jgi:protein-tyrosine-phosphatase